jgi:hypothetical protein
MVEDMARKPPGPMYRGEYGEYYKFAIRASVFSVAPPSLKPAFA